MGSVTLPAAGRVYLDAQTIVYTVEKHPEFSPLLRRLWEAVAAGAAEVVTSERTILEVLVMPPRRGDAALVKDYEGLFEQRGVRLWMVDRAILRAAAALRAASPRLRTPDAIHAGTAIAAGCVAFVTNDRALRDLPAPGVCILADAAA